MENLWIRAHEFITDSVVGDYYYDSCGKNEVIRRTNRRVYFSNGDIIGIRKSRYGFFYLSGKSVNKVLRDIEGYFIYKIHSGF